MINFIKIRNQHIKPILRTYFDFPLPILVINKGYFLIDLKIFQSYELSQCLFIIESNTVKEFSYI